MNPDSESASQSHQRQRSRKYANRGNDCYFRHNNGTWIPFPILDSSHREADQVIPLHSVYVGPRPEDMICIVADDTDIYLSLIHISHKIKSSVFFEQGSVSNKTMMLSL